MTKAQKITDIKKGTVIKFIDHETAEYLTEVNYPMEKLMPVARVLDADKKSGSILVQFPDGTKRVIDWVEFIIYILPLLEKIVFIVKGWFTKKKGK